MGDKDIITSEAAKVKPKCARGCGREVPPGVIVCRECAVKHPVGVE